MRRPVSMGELSDTILSKDMEKDASLSLDAERRIVLSKDEDWGTETPSDEVLFSWSMLMLPLS